MLLKYYGGKDAEHLSRWYGPAVTPSSATWKFLCTDVWRNVKEEFQENLMDAEINSIEVSRIAASKDDMFVDEVFIGQREYYRKCQMK